MFIIFLLVRILFSISLSPVQFSNTIDEQNCTLKFASWTYDSARIDLTEKTRIGDLSNFMNNSGLLTLAERSF